MQYIGIQLEVNSLEIKGMTLVVYKYINCSVDKLLALATYYTTNYSIIIILIITTTTTTTIIIIIV